MYGKLQTSLSDTIINQLIEYAQNGCDNRQRADLINKLRRIFAGISIDMLDPDLVIMDEFQRFNSLLEQSDDEQSMLANKFSITSDPIPRFCCFPLRPTSHILPLKS